MKKLRGLIFCGFVLWGPTYILADSFPILLPEKSNQAFGVGEILKFELSYEFVPAGEASLEVRAGEPVNGRETYFIESIAKSNSFVDVFFKVRDYNASQIDSKSLASVSFIQNLQEGHYEVFRQTRIDYFSGSYEYKRQYKGKTHVRVGTVTTPMSDILSAFYYVRTLPLKPGEKYALQVFSDQSEYSLEIEVGPKLKTIKVPAGKFECLRVQPKVVGDAIFKAKEGKMTIWMSNDDKKLPVLLQSKVIIGSFDGELKEYTLSSK